MIDIMCSLKEVSVGNRKLDMEIAFLINWKSTPLDDYVPYYTTSLDAAMTLIPESCDYINFISDPSGNGWEIGEFLNGLTDYRKRGEYSSDNYILALCVAALEAYMNEILVKLVS